MSTNKQFEDLANQEDEDSKLSNQVQEELQKFIDEDNDNEEGEGEQASKEQSAEDNSATENKQETDVSNN